MPPVMASTYPLHRSSGAVKGPVGGSPWYRPMCSPARPPRRCGGFHPLRRSWPAFPSRIPPSSPVLCRPGLSRAAQALPARIPQHRYVPSRFHDRASLHRLFDCRLFFLLLPYLHGKVNRFVPRFLCKVHIFRFVSSKCYKLLTIHFLYHTMILPYTETISCEKEATVKHRILYLLSALCILLTGCSALPGNTGDEIAYWTGEAPLPCRRDPWQRPPAPTAYFYADGQALPYREPSPVPCRRDSSPSSGAIWWADLSSRTSRRIGLPSPSPAPWTPSCAACVTRSSWIRAGTLWRGWRAAN